MLRGPSLTESYYQDLHSTYVHALKTPLSAAEERAPHRGPVLILIFNHSVNVFSFNNSLCLHQSFLSPLFHPFASRYLFFSHCLLRWKHVNFKIERIMPCQLRSRSAVEQRLWELLGDLRCLCYCSSRVSM